MTSRGILPPSGRAIATPRVAGFKSEWPRSNRNRWPTSLRNQWPPCSGISTWPIEAKAEPQHADEDGDRDDEPAPVKLCDRCRTDDRVILHGRQIDLCA